MNLKKHTVPSAGDTPEEKLRYLNLLSASIVILPAIASIPGPSFAELEPWADSHSSESTGEYLRGLGVTLTPIDAEYIFHLHPLKNGEELMMAGQFLRPQIKLRIQEDYYHSTIGERYNATSLVR